MADDLYQLSDDRALDPPANFSGKLRHLGPGFILSASIVGSGELIATTNFGAEAGFVCMWVIIFSCIVKVTLQLEFGKHAIYSGKTTIDAFNELPGPKFGRASWSIWAWLLAMTLKFLQVGGIIGLVAVALQTLRPISSNAVGEVVWTVLAGLAVALLIARGRYALIERTCLVMIGLFTLFTLISVIALQWTDYSISGAELASGLTFTFPSEAILFAAIAAFGITGVGGDEIMAYNYWLIEKGYARHTGPRPPESDRETHDAWLARARGWTRVMTLDALFSLLCYTLVTVLFYLLGAAVVHQMHEGTLPDGAAALLAALSSMYTESLGPWAKWVFMVGAVVVLFSTLLAALGAWTRLFADAFSHVGIGDFHDPARRRKAIAIGSFVIPAIWGTLYFIFSNPKFMILIGGFITAVILLLVLFAAFVMRYRWSPPQLRPKPLYDLALWLSALAIAFAGGYSIITGLAGYFNIDLFPGSGP